MARDTPKRSQKAGSLIVAGSPPGREKGKKYISVSVCTPRRHSYITIQLARFSRSSLSSSQTKLKKKKTKPLFFFFFFLEYIYTFIRLSLFFSFLGYFFKNKSEKRSLLLLRII
jgi:hypothetical protein